MYNLMIHLKNQEEITVNEFKELTICQAGKSKTFNTDFSSIIIINSLTYNFKGSVQVSMNGSEISYLSLYEVKSD
ncbi:hypothetical protein [Lactococcus fujiensis]|uniref:hypothetical protein n=1 Tax=Lactococcus fujiensis TaxID=610251 RepID=UPI0006CF2540|nr:hypothetical protein [Lactococcus fujiensis]